jgi:hypothetical protein
MLSVMKFVLWFEAGDGYRSGQIKTNEGFLDGAVFKVLLFICLYYDRRVLDL